ncbi:MAG: potassium channel protein [Desulfobacteraceae bacterium]|nr:potassium channel protein [Desulfobacteraceae bacterium]
MNNTKHFAYSLVFSFLLIVAGTVGYMLIEGWNFLDSFFMTITTLATVGYGEVHPLTPWGRIFSIVLIVLGVGFFFYVGGAVIQFMLEGRVRALLGRRRLDRKLARLKNHYIVCGCGRIGKVICEKLQRENFDLVVIDKNPSLIETLEAMKLAYLCGDAGDEALLLKAGIQQAKALVAALATDTENVFLVLTARQLAPKIKIIARAGTEAAKSKLKTAGADIVEAPYENGAYTMAQRIIRPTVTNFLDLAFATHRHKDIQMEEIPVTSKSTLHGLMLKDSGIRQKYNLIIIAIKKEDDQMLFNPSYEAKLSAGDTVIAVGEPGSLKRLEAVLNPSETKRQAPDQG